jgi:hypothetical protein
MAFQVKDTIRSKTCICKDVIEQLTALNILVVVFHTKMEKT